MNKVVFLLSLGVLFATTLSSPIEKNGKDESPTLTREKRTFNFGLFHDRDWAQFRNTLRLPTFSTMPNLMNLFLDEELRDNLRKRIVELENGQRRIIDFLQRMQAADKYANSCDTRGTTQQPERLPEPVAVFTNLKVDVATRATGTTTSISTQATTFSSVENPETEFQTEQEATTTRITTIEKSIQKNENDVYVAKPMISTGSDAQSTPAVDDSLELNDGFV